MHMWTRIKDLLLSREKGRKFVILIPYGWLLLFFMLPFLIILKISFSEAVIGMPPYKPIVTWVGQNFAQFTLNLENYKFLFFDNLYILSYMDSILMAGFSTLIALLIGYPMAYGITQSSKNMQKILLLLVMLPFWTSFVLRVYAWIMMLNTSGLINNVLMDFGIISHPLKLLYTDGAISIGIVYCYLPFMILPLYATLEKFDRSYLEAAADLGCRPFRRFISITLPLTKSGIIAGCMLVFIPAMGEFVIPELLGSSEFLAIGRILWNEFFTNRDWPVASALAIMMLLLMCLPILYFQRSQEKS